MSLQIYINGYKHIPYEAIYCWLTESNYGGHITDDWDQRIFNTILNDFCGHNVIEIPSYSFHHEYKVPLRFDYRDFISSIEVTMPCFLILLYKNFHIHLQNCLCDLITDYSFNSVAMYFEGLISVIIPPHTHMQIDYFIN